MKFLYMLSIRKLYYVVIDILIVLFSYLAAYFVCFSNILDSRLELLSLSLFLLLLTSTIFIFYLFQIYRIMWIYSNTLDVYKIILANVVSALFWVGAIYFFNIDHSRVVLLLAFLFISISVIFYRILIRDYYFRKRFSNKFNMSKIKSLRENKNILIIGAGESGRIVLAEFTKRGISDQIIGFADDNKKKIGEIINGKRVLCNVYDIGELFARISIDEVLITMPSVGSQEINKIVDRVKKLNSDLPVKILPALIELDKSKPLMNSLRKISISDLIGREEFSVDKEKITKNFEGKTVLITGAGGSIGSEICRQLLKFKIKKIVAVGRGEYSIYELIKSLNVELEDMEFKPTIVYKIANVKDYSLMKKIFKEENPSIVFHAAAHKHVPLMEFNEIEAIQNNVLGTKNVLELSTLFDIEKFVFISTDKAVRPTNIMGTTKRLAEILTEYYNFEKKLNTVVVRFGNVLGSRGSVVPLFQEQIEKGGPVTVTHPNVKRFFMSIYEASLLVINASILKSEANICVLNMGNQYKIVDIAKRLIRLYGFEPEIDIKIEYSGMRPGEKMYEELFYDEKAIIKTENEKIFVLRNKINKENFKIIESFLKNDFDNLVNLNSVEIREFLSEFVQDCCIDKEVKLPISKKLVS